MKQNILKSLFISIILLAGATNVWAISEGNDWRTASNAKVYFDNTKSSYTNVSMLIGRQWNYDSDKKGSWGEDFALISGTTNLYYKSITCAHYTTFAFINATGWNWEENNTVTGRLNWCTNTDTPNDNLGSMTHLYVPESGNDNASITHTTHSSYTELNYEQKVQQHLSTDNGSNYSASTLALATVKVSSKKLKSDNATEDSSGTIASGSSTASCSAARTATVTYNVSGTKEGYEFIGWYDGTTEKYTQTTYTYNATEVKTITARFKANQYTVTLNQQSGSGGTTSVTATYGSAMPAITIPTRNGYTFKGYYDAQSGGTQYYKADGSSARTWNKTAATTLYAQWELATYTITYDNLKGATHTNPATYTINSATITFTAPTSKPAGYTFANWSPASIATGSTGNKTVTANWTAATSTVELNQEEATEKGTTSVTATYGSAMPAITKLPIRTGYTFGGYYTGKNGAGTQYYKADGTSATTWNLEGAQTLYAKWTANTYKVKFNGNGSTSGSMSDQSFTYDETAKALTANAFSRTGYNFVCWNTQENGLGTNYTDKALVQNLTATNNATINLYAQWTEKAANTVYLKPAKWWKDNNARSAIWAWNNSESVWIDVDYNDCTGELYQAEIPAKYTGLQFVRLKPSSADGYDSGNNGYNNENVWTRTENLTVPTDSKNLYDMTSTNIKYIYLKPNDDWKKDGAKFEACFNSTEYIQLEDIGNGLYRCENKGGKVQFNRVDPTNGYNKWNQTGDLTILSDKNCFNITSWDGGEWTMLWDDTFWTTYTAPTFNVTINSCENGTIKVVYDGKTYTSGAEDVIIKDVDIHSELTITFTPAEGYELTTPLVTYADIVADNIYSICGPTVISAEFVQRGSTKVIYLRPNDEWLKDDAIFIAHAWKDGSSDQHDYLMTTKDTDYTGSYSCTIDKKYDHVLFARINPEYKTNQELSEKWMWNKTIDLQITNDVLEEHGYRFAIGEKVGGEGENKDHYNGVWEENTPIWGITSDFNNWHAEDAVFMGYPGKLNILLSAVSHEFKLYNFRHGHYYGNTGTYQRTNSGQWWTMDLHNDEGNNCTVKADIDNEAYLFQLQLITELGTYKKQISITYPDFTGGAYRLAYKDNTPGSFHPAHYIKYNASEEVHLDTISFFIHHDKEPEIWLQQCTDGIYTQNPTWKTIAIYPATSSFPTSDNPGNAMLPGKRNSDATLHIGNGCGITESGVYNFILQQTNNPGHNPDHNAVLNATDTHPYKGDYYIRTDSAEGGWTNYQEASNLMTYSSYADHNEPFSYYFCKWIHSDTKTANKGNVTYTVANDYSRCISDTLVGDNIIGVEDGFLPDSANVRFTWDHETNALARAYIRGSGHSSDRFLVLTGKDNNLKDADGKDIPAGTGDLNGILANEKLLTDMGNWIYQVDVKANKETAIKLTAKYNDKTQYFKGSANEFDNLLESTDNNYYKIRIIYDFKTNQLITAWLPDNSNVTEDKELGIDMMIIRTNHEQATQINFTNNKSISDVGIGYAVMTFTEGHVLGSGTQYARSLYWVSFPFDVWLRDVTGFGEYGQHWIMEYYDGASRAQNGLWADSDTYWKYITNPNYKLEAGKGYVLCLNLGKMQNAFTHTDKVSLYFPSTSPLQEISGEVTAAEVPAHTCTIERDNRNIYDSNWNLIGVPGFKDITGVGVGGSAHEEADPNVNADCVSFYYAYQSNDNSYLAEAETNNFQIMHSYMVQFAGTIEWSSLANPPASVAARRTGEMPSEHTLRLELAQGEDKADQTIIKLQEQNATTDFDMNIDMAKIKNSGANIYTLTENTAIMVAGNALPMEKTTIPVGIEVANAGTYTLRMPDGTDGISVTLIDNQTGIHTDMLLSEYTITLDAGSHLNRFYIAVDPDRTATSVENVGEEAKGDKTKGVEKYLIDGQLFIRTAEGIFDARGRKL